MYVSDDSLISTPLKEEKRKKRRKKGRKKLVQGVHILWLGWERGCGWVNKATADGDGRWDTYTCSRTGAAVMGVPTESIIELLPALPLYYTCYCLVPALIISHPLFKRVLPVFRFPPMLLPVSCENIGYQLKTPNGFSLLT